MLNSYPLYLLFHIYVSWVCDNTLIYYYTIIIFIVNNIGKQTWPELVFVEVDIAG